MPVLKSCADVKVTDMFISVNRCEIGQNPGKTAVMEVGEEFGIKVHALVTVQDIREYLADQGGVRTPPAADGRLHEAVLRILKFAEKETRYSLFLLYRVSFCHFCSCFRFSRKIFMREQASRR